MIDHICIENEQIPKAIAVAREFIKENQGNPMAIKMANAFILALEMRMSGLQIAHVPIITEKNKD